MNALPNAGIARLTSQRSPDLRRFPLLVPASLAGCVIATLVVLDAATTGDYVTHGLVGGDNPAPAIDALLHGHLATLAAQQPLMGLVSILLRAPFAALAMLWHGGNLAAYRLGALACLIPAGLFGGWLIAAGRRASGGLIGPMLVAALMLAGPATRSALVAGHPEEILAAVLVVGSVISAMRSHDVWGAILLGLAIGTKQWALVGVPPLLAAIPAGRLRAVAVLATVAGLTSLPAPLADPAAFRAASHDVGNTHLANAIGIWWHAGAAWHTGTGSSAPPVRVLPLGLSRSDASLLMFALTAVPLVAYARAARRKLLDPLALLALLLLLRCVCDPLPLEYYYAPLLVALGAWETLSRQRLPVMTLLAAALVSAAFGPGLRLAPDLHNLLALSSTAALGAVLVRGAWFSAASPRHTEWA